MRLIFATILMALLASSAANASSFVTLPEITSPTSPSIITLGGSSPSIIAAGEPSIERFGGLPADGRKFVTVSPSVIAMVDAAQPIAFENVASIDDERNKKRLRDTLPMVIRGGIIGDAFVSRAAPASSGSQETPKPQQQVSAPKPGSKKPAPSPKEPSSPGDDRVPKSALPPPAPPTGRME